MTCFKQVPDQLVRLAIVILVVVVLTGREAEAGAISKSWGYSKENGPNKWYEKYPDCASSMQSPININTSQTVYSSLLTPFNFSNYIITDDIKMTAENVGGHTAEVKVSGGDVILQGGSLPGPYRLEQFHFHWGGESTRGSEHSIDGTFFPLELHIVHSKASFRNVTVAVGKPFGLAVVAVLFEEGSNNDVLDKFLENFDKIVDANEETEIETFQVSDLFPVIPFRYYRYYGSLTTPPCTESVIWTVVVQRLQISSEQLEKFRSLFDQNHNPLVDDFRPSQPLDARTVLTSVPPSD